MVLIYKEFSAWITIEGEDSEEYRVDLDPETKTASCWIPSEAGRTFKVHWHDSQRRFATDGLVIIDGQRCGGKVIHTDRDKPDSACKEGLRISGSSIRPFTFSPVTFTDDELFADIPVPRAIGDIELLLFRVEVQKREPFLHRKVPKKQVLYEGMKTGIQHQTTYGHALEGESREAVNVLQISQSPIARFHFRYRPIEMLRAMGVAPIIIRQSSPPGPSLGFPKYKFSTKPEDDLVYPLTDTKSHCALGSSADQPIIIPDDVKYEDNSPNLSTRPLTTSKPLFARSDFKVSPSLNIDGTVSPKRKFKFKFKDEDSEFVLDCEDEEEADVKEMEQLKARLNALQAKQLERQRKKAKIKHER